MTLHCRIGRLGARFVSASFKEEDGITPLDYVRGSKALP